MSFEFHEKNCNCAYCKSDYEKNPLGNALWHAGYFSDKERSLNALKKTLECMIERNIEEDGCFDSMIEFHKKVIHETENFKTNEMYKKRGFYKKCEEK